MSHIYIEDYLTNRWQSCDRLDRNIIPFILFIYLFIFACFSIYACVRLQVENDSDDGDGGADGMDETALGFFSQGYNETLLPDSGGSQVPSSQQELEGDNLISRPHKVSMCVCVCVFVCGMCIREE